MAMHISRSQSENSVAPVEEVIVFYNFYYEEHLMSQFKGESELSQPSAGLQPSAALFSSSDPLDWDVSDDILCPPLSPIKFAEEVEAVKSEVPPVEAASAPMVHKVELKSDKQVSRASPYVAPSKAVAADSRKRRGRGRPLKQESDVTSKTASYAKQYRELKKQQLQEAESLVSVLREENETLRSEKADLVAAFDNLQEEVARLRAQLGQYSSSDGFNPLKNKDACLSETEFSYY